MSKGRSWNLLHPPYLSKFASLVKKLKKKKKKKRNSLKKWERSKKIKTQKV